MGFLRDSFENFTRYFSVIYPFVKRSQPPALDGLLVMFLHLKNINSGRYISDSNMRNSVFPVKKIILHPLVAKEFLISFNCIKFYLTSLLAILRRS